MMRPILLSAVLTGIFCACFAVGIDWLTDMLERGQVIGVSFLSGFLGSLFASAFIRRDRET
ncbi:MAG: hypothetical protein QNJ20_01615 [Paracoccaceae bacterium]|nr:hypothetical protein [Paracoccaceae bacterium]